MLIGYIDYDKEKGSAYMPILWDESMGRLNVWKSYFEGLYGKRITWLENWLEIKK
jgi:hypothetical protein